MTQITIKHVGIEQAPNKNGKGFYEKAEIIYADQSGQTKTKKITDFANKQVFAVFKSAKPGDVIDVTLEKVGDYWNFTAAAPAGSGGTTAPSTSSGPSQSGYQRAPQVNNFQRDFETKAEREIKQRLIVRQSSIAQAVAMLSPGAKAKIELDAVTDLADELVAWVYQAPNLFDQPNDDPDATTDILY